MDPDSSRIISTSRPQAASRSGFRAGMAGSCGAARAGAAHGTVAAIRPRAKDSRSDQWLLTLAPENTAKP
jgi:hypothetical protein